MQTLHLESLPLELMMPGWWEGGHSSCPGSCSVLGALEPPRPKFFHLEWRRSLPGCRSWYVRP